MVFYKVVWLTFLDHSVMFGEGLKFLISLMVRVLGVMYWYVLLLLFVKQRFCYYENNVPCDTASRISVDSLAVCDYNAKYYFGGTGRIAKAVTVCSFDVDS